MKEKRERPAWKALALKRIKHLSIDLRQAGMTREELSAVYKRFCGVSRFRDLDYCMDTPLNKLIEGLEKMGNED